MRFCATRRGSIRICFEIGIVLYEKFCSMVLDFVIFPCYSKKNQEIKETRRKREYICPNFTERFPTYRGLLRGNEERQMEDGFGVAGMNCFLPGYIIGTDIGRADKF